MYSRWAAGGILVSVLRLTVVVTSLVSVSSCSLLFDEVSTAVDAGSQDKADASGEFDGGNGISPDLLCGDRLLEGVLDQFIVDNSIGKKRLKNSVPGADKARLYQYSGGSEEERVLVPVSGLPKCGLAMDTSIDAEAGIYARVKHDRKYNTLPFSADFCFLRSLSLRIRAMDC